jgi:hypothetical protein
MGQRPTYIYNIYAPAGNRCKAETWYEKRLLLLLLANKQSGWDVVIGGDFNGKLTKLDDHHCPSSFCPMCAITKLQSAPLKLVDLFRLINGDQLKFLYTKYTCAGAPAGGSPIEQLPCNTLALINSFLTPSDASRWLAASKWVRHKFLGRTLTQSQLDYLLVQPNHNVVSTNVLEDSPLFTDHCPVSVNIRVCLASSVLCVPITGSTRIYNSKLLANTRKLEGLQAALIEAGNTICNNRLLDAAGVIDGITDAILQYCDRHLCKWLQSFCNEGEWIGITHHYLNKAVKTGCHLLRLQEGECPTTTKYMRQLGTAPDWASCPLPSQWTASTLTLYSAQIGALHKRLSS